MIFGLLLFFFSGTTLNLGPISIETIELDTGVVRTLELGSPPDAVGVLPNADMAFVSQRHPLGRISFIDIATGDARTITGFDLNSQIID